MTTSTTHPLAERIAERIARPIPPQNDTPIGTVSRERAEYLMGSAAAFGGAIYVSVAQFIEMYVGDGRMGRGGDPVATRLVPRERMIRRLRGELERAGRLARHDGYEGIFAEIAEDLLWILDDIEARGAIVPEPSA